MKVFFMQYGWVYRPGITSYEKLLFYIAMQRHRDPYYYYPIALADRVEIGMKYHFFCIAIPKADPGYPSHFVDIGIYKPPAGMPYATCIYCEDFDNMFPMRMY